MQRHIQGRYIRKILGCVCLWTVGAEVYKMAGAAFVYIPHETVFVVKPSGYSTISSSVLM